MKSIALILALMLGACSTAPVKPWQRGDLARKDMAWNPDPMQTEQRDHINKSKEGASGGISTGGGGCGCY